jgi:hypothetical protein
VRQDLGVRNAGMAGMASSILKEEPEKLALGEEVAGDAEEEEQTPEQRLQWLRDRGIVVETPEDRVAQRGLEASMARLRAGDPGTRTFRFVRIPADAAMPLSEEEAVVPVAEEGEASGVARGVDRLTSLLKARFSGGAVDEAALKSTAAAHHLTNTASAAVLEKLSAASVAAGGGAVEAFRVADGVNLYLDAVGALKQLPPNPRASRLAARCGFGEVPFFGDMFIGRLHGGGGGGPPGSNADFTLADMIGFDGATPPAWLGRAAQENLERQRREGGAGRAAAAGGMTADELAARGGEGYTWSQTQEDVEVVVPLPEGMRAKRCKVVFGVRRLKVVVPAAGAEAEAAPYELLIDPLFGKIAPDDSTWTVSDGKLVVTLEKIKAKAVWPSLG